MSSIINKVTNFIGDLTITDIIFFASAMSLLIIGITLLLIALRKKEKTVILEKPKSMVDTYSDDLLGLLPEDNSKDEVVKPVNDLPPVDDEPEVLLDLATLTKALENPSFDHIDMEKYEKEEEERAIISYEELLENTGNYKINYAEETDTDGFSVKRVDLANLTSLSDEVPNKTTKVYLVSYNKEEAFLKSLKELQRLLE